MLVEEIKFNYDLGVFGDTLKRIVLKEYPHRLTDFIDSFSNNQVTCKKWLVLELLKILKNKLLSEADLITPNIPEAEVLTNSKISTIQDVILAGNHLIELGAKNVLIKGGHLKYKNIQDVFINKKEITIFKNKKINTKNSHGTGCTLSSAITTYFSCGKTLKKSCEMAIKYVNHSLRTQPNLGKGHGPVNHLNSIQIKKNFR